MERSKVLAALSALANDCRLDLVRMLMPHGEDGLSAGVIGERLGLGPSRLSFHLAALEQAGLIRSRRASRNVFYSIDVDGMVGTVNYLVSDCCCGDPRIAACCNLPASAQLPVGTLKT
ncbi:MAG: transcriptional regulator [Cereibacter sphaeroides]|uniref:Transcriptional regulator n=1 Tax=Cereibacter sphaeroides TaxID=1063 RepID=A0A2W5TUS7_CERSP|nr:MAG: transcriptional regulator [Cereibacter sphaeroides]